jgi:hypothetical protein
MFQSLQRKLKHTVYVQYFFALKIVPFMRYLRKNMADPVRPQMAIQYGAWALYAG